MATRNIEIEDLEEYFKEIISKKESIRSLSQKIGVPRNTLARKIRKTYENDSRYEQYRDIINSYQHSGGRIGENKKGFTYACTHNLQPFFEKYCQYKREYMQDKEIIAMMNVTKATFYRKIAAYKAALISGELKIQKKDFVFFPEEIKQEILYQKLNREREKLKCKSISRVKFDIRLKKILEYFLEDRNENIREKNCLMEEDDVYGMLLSNIKIIDFDLNKNIRPSAENIDRIIGRELSNLLMKSKPNVLSLCKEKVEELLCLAIDEGYFKTYIRSDDRWTSGEKMYALIQYAKEQAKTENQLNWLSKQVVKKCSQEELLEKYPYPERYKRIGEKPVKGEPYDNDDWAR